MSDAPILLTDEAMQGFVREGYVTVQSELPKSYHDAMYARLEPLEEDGLVGHNNLLPMVPELRELLDEPVVRGALLSVLGPDCYLHFHRHDHVNMPEKVQPMQAWHRGDGRLHKDGERHAHHMVDGRRHHATRFAMLFYYPQDTTWRWGRRVSCRAASISCGARWTKARGSLSPATPGRSRSCISTSPTGAMGRTRRTFPVTW